MASLLYQGHGSYRITTSEGMVLYVDPFAGEGYDLPADAILVTHEHGDHNCVDLVHQTEDCTLITAQEALHRGRRQSFDLGFATVEAVEAANRNHSPAECVGYLITVDGIQIYASGDTSKTQQMKELASRKLDYALLPGDGIYNMDLEEASECAALIAARHSIPIHLKPGSLFDRSRAEGFQAPGRLILEPGQEITL